MKNDLKRFEIADAQAECTEAALAAPFHPSSGAFGAEEEKMEGWADGGMEGRSAGRGPFLDSRAFQ